MVPVPPSAPHDGDPADLVRRAATAFATGHRCLLLSRVEAGGWCHAFYRCRLAAGFTDRAESSRVLTAALRPHADSERECEPNMLSKLYFAVQLLADGSDSWKDSALTLGKLEALAPLILRDTATETCALFMPAKEAECKALVTAACESGAKRISLEELRRRVLGIVNPEKAKDRGPRKPAEGRRGADAEGKNGSDQRGVVTGNILNPDLPYTAKDAAELSVGIMAKSDRPDDALEALLITVSKHADFGQKSRRAVKATLVALQRDDKPGGSAPGLSPVQVAGVLVPAAS